MSKKTPKFVPPPSVGQPILTPREVFSLLKRGHTLVREALPLASAASATPSYHIEVDGLRRPVASNVATAAINSGRIGHGMQSGGDFIWKQTTKTP